MQADKDEQQILNRALEEWTRNGSLSREKAEELRKDIVVREDQGRQLATYLLVIALACAILGVAALLIDEKILERLRRNFLLSHYFIAGGTALLASICFWYTHHRASKISELNRELNMLLGATFTLVSLTYFCKVWGNGPAYTGLTGLFAICFFGLSLLIRSRVLWLIFLFAAMGWYGTFSTWHQSQGLFLGMNYPVRFTLFGLMLILLAASQKYWLHISLLQNITFQLGLLVFYTGLCGIAVFGNTGDLETWQAIRQTTMLPFAIGCGVLTALLLFAGIRWNRPVLRDFSLLFLLLQLYTHYFTYFWDALNKGLFFLFLAVSLGLLARWLRKRDAR